MPSNVLQPHLVLVQEWLTSMGIKYYESKMNLNWKPILKNITEVRRAAIHLPEDVLRTQVHVVHGYAKLSCKALSYTCPVVRRAWQLRCSGRQPEHSAACAAWRCVLAPIEAPGCS